MTRKHFKALADALKAARPDAVAERHFHAMYAWTSAVENVAAACRSFNPNFDRTRFYAACGYGEG